MMDKKIEQPKVEVGSVWQEDNPRQERFVKVFEIGEKYISGKSTQREPCAIVFPCTRDGVEIARGGFTKIALRRFGRAGGFKRPGECRQGGVR